MYRNNYPDDYDDKNIVDGTAREMGEVSCGSDSRQSRTEDYSGSYSSRMSTGDSMSGSYYGSTTDSYSSQITTRSSYGGQGTVDSSGRQPSSGSYSSQRTASGFSGQDTTSGSYHYSSSQGSSFHTGSSNTNTGSFSIDTDNTKEEKEKQPKKTGGFIKKAVAAMAFGIFFGVCAGVSFHLVEKAFGNEKEMANLPETAEVEPVQEIAANQEPAALITTDVTPKTENTATVLDVSDVAAQVMPAIVSINNTTTQTISYFGRTLQSEAVGAGSGIIVGESDSELLIVSNYHVVEDSSKLVVQFADGSEVEARMKGSDPDMDLAVIAVSLEDIEAATRAAITIAQLGDSDTLIVGEPAIAIGNALGYGQSVTTGVISALDRVIDLSTSEELYGYQSEMDKEETASFIQTDAAINPGNSGGALLNIKGEVIGINSNKIGGSTIEGMGYAIPISAAKPIIEELMLRETRSKVGEEKKGYLGVTSLTVVDQMAQDYGMPRGVYVSEVVAGSAAERAGIVRGNIITEFGGNKISSTEDLASIMDYYAAGEVVEVEIMQGSPSGWESKTVMVILGRRME